MQESNYYPLAILLGTTKSWVLVSLLGNIPPRHRNEDGSLDLDTLFRVARGRAPTGKPAAASEMTKNGLILTITISCQNFSKDNHLHWRGNSYWMKSMRLLALGHNVKPVLLGPITYLWLGKVKGPEFDRLSLLDAILPVYQQVLSQLQQKVSSGYKLMSLHWFLIYPLSGKMLIKLLIKH